MRLAPHTPCARALLGALLVAASVAAGRALAGEALQGADPAQLRTELWAAIGAEGELYRGFRDRLLQRGSGILPFLERTAQEGEAWQERVMAGILLERLSRPEEIKGVVEWWSQVQVHRDFGTNVRTLGKSLAGRAGETPLLLVEKIWKGNELRNKAVPLHWDGAWAADALGYLREARAFHPLTLMLTEIRGPLKGQIRVTMAAGALQKLDDSRAVPALCQAYVLYSSERPGTAAFEAIREIGDHRDAPTVRAFGATVSDREVRAQLQILERTLAKKVRRKRASP